MTPPAQCPWPPDGVRCRLAEDAADAASDAAVKKTFAILGVDIDDPAQVESFRHGLRVGQTISRALDKGILVAAGVITAGLMAALWLGLLEKAKAVLK